MLKVNFYDNVEDNLLKFAVIVAKSQGKWVLCKHKERNTYEFPGGHREAGEDILTAAKRELFEETGAVDYSITQVCVYSVAAKDDIPREESFGMLYYADIRVFEELPDLEIVRIEFFDELPGNWTYPEIQPFLLEKINPKLFE
ncbi:MAG: NUDIX domain-containing protein [Mobilitalea sp.]